MARVARGPQAGNQTLDELRQHGFRPMAAWKDQSVHQESRIGKLLQLTNII
jgi:hypothetical protein